MKIRSRVWRVALAVAGSTAAVGLTVGAAAGTAAAGPILTPGAGDATAVVGFDADGAITVTNGYRYTSSGGGVLAGRVDATHFWVTFPAMGGGTYISALLSNWTDVATPSIDPVCTIDKTKDNGVDVSVWFQCTPYPTATLAGESVVISLTNRPHPDRAGTTVPGFVAITTTDATLNHTPAGQYRSSGTGSATVTHLGTGRYQVTVPNAPLGKGLGTVFTSALTTSAAVDLYYTRYCNPQSWGSVGTNLIVYVNCYGGMGDLRDGRFSMRFTTRNLLGGTQPGGTQWVSAPESTYDTTAYGWNSAGAANRVAPQAAMYGVGTSSVEFLGATNFPTRVVTMAVSAYGGNQRCSLVLHNGGPDWPSAGVSTRCFAPSTGAGVTGGKYSVGLAQL